MKHTASTDQSAV